MVVMAAVLLGMPMVVPAQETPRTAWGDPDLNGVWDFRTLTPFERPEELAAQEFFTEEEAAAFEANKLAEFAVRDDQEPADIVGNYNQFWFDPGTNVIETNRTSLVVAPTDGRVPSRTAVAQARARARAEKRGRTHSIQDRSITERCVLGFNAGPPMNPGAYNNNVMLLQIPGMVVLHNEMVHEVRFIPLDGRDHLPQEVRQLRGDSRGHWDGQTLVVETTNYTDRTNYMGSGDKMRLIERFTRVDDATLLYEYTVEDSESFEQPWTVALPMTRTDGPMFEFACHEGNYGLTNILSAARAEERRGASNTSR